MRHVILPAVVAAALAASAMGSVRAATAVLESPLLSVTVDSSFPRIVQYKWKAGGALIYGEESATTNVMLNGTNYAASIKFERQGKDGATYRLTFAPQETSLTLSVRVTSNIVDLAVTELKEQGAFKVRTLRFPGLRLISVRSDQPGAAFTASRLPGADVTGRVADAAAEAKPAGYTHVVLNTDQLAASCWNNVLLDAERWHVQTEEKAGVKTCGVRVPFWTYREVETERVELPLARVAIVADANGDGRVDWQDGALAARQLEPLPFGCQYVGGRVVSQIAMNFASWAQHPFLRVLDNEKKVFLYTDGLGQEVQFKGYQAEGHDSSHPDYGGNVGRRQGGRDDLNVVMARGKDFGVRSGVHINATEYYPEARHYAPDLVNTNKKGWAWLDQSYYTDQRYDVVSGKLYARLDELRADLPALDWVYVDVYFGTGWVARKLATKMNSLGMPIYTEFPGLMERYVTWNHTSQDWTQKVWGDGRKSRLARFIQNQTRDVWPHDPLLRGSNNDGFMGWHSQRDVTAVIRSAFCVNLPSKYLQHYPILRWADDRIDFADGVAAVKDGEDYEILHRGRLLNAARYPQPNRPPADNRLFMPWPPGEEAKIYYWNDRGGAAEWALPESWRGADRVRLYQLTDLGRVFVRDVPVRGGKVTLDERPGTPYVLYRGVPPSLPDIVWGEGGLVKDPGFDSHSFNWWKPSSEAGDVGHVRILNDANGQTHLRVQGNGGAGAEIAQTLYNLAGGKTYAASVWVELKGQRAASLSVRPYAPAQGFRPIDRAGWKIVRVSSAQPGAGAEGPAARALDGNPATFWHTQWSPAVAPPPHEFVVDMGAAQPVSGFTYLPRANHGNGTIKDFAFYLGADGEQWGAPAAKGSFEAAERDGDAWRVTWPAPKTARFFRLVALSELADQAFASAAELNVLAPPAPAAGAFPEATVRVAKTDVRNYSDNSDKYLMYYQRIKLLFDLPEGADKAELVLRAEPGAPDSSADFDDARVVASGRTPQGGHAFFEDFENVDEGWGPFVYGYKGNMQTPLSEANPPFTRDTLNGQFSLKTKDEAAGLNYRSLPALLPFKPNAAYRLSFDYLTLSNNQYRVVVRSDAAGTTNACLAADLPDQPGVRARYSGDFKTGAFDDCYVGLVKNTKDKGELVIDNVTVDEVTP